MEILLNDSILGVEGIDGEATVLELLTIVEETLKGSQATIIEVVLDEQSYSADDISEVSASKILSFQKIEIFTATAAQMVRAAFADGAAGLQHLEERATASAADLRIGKIKEGMDSYIEFVDGIEWLVTVLKNADLAFAANMAESSLESDRQALTQRLGEQMQQAHLMQEAQDWVGLADILEYEFPEILQDSGVFINNILAA